MTSRAPKRSRSNPWSLDFSALVDPTGLQSQFTWPVVNNFPLEILCETGLIGFLVLVAGAACWAGRSGAPRARAVPSGDDWRSPPQPPSRCGHRC